MYTAFMESENYQKRDRDGEKHVQKKCKMTPTFWQMLVAAY